MLTVCSIKYDFFSSLKAEVADARERTKLTGGRYRQNQLLDELRRLRESLARERKQWTQERDEKELEMANKRRELERMQVGDKCFRYYFTCL